LVLLALTVAACSAVLVVLHVGAMAVVARAIGARPTKVSFFYGPRVVKRLVGGVEVEVRLLPMGGYVSFGPTETPMAGLLGVSRAAEAAVMLCGVGALVVTGVLLGEPLRALGDDWVRCFTVVTSSFDERSAMVQGWLRLLSTSPKAAFGQLAMLLAAVNLLPVAALNGGRVLELVVGAALRRPRVWRFPPSVAMVGVLAMLVFSGAWLVAVGMAVLAAR
jgi:membrane-associated protease RseP (regulator of RpoE activity)